METTEKIVEAYCRYVKCWATIPNIRCPGQYEIDLIAINPLTVERYHIESGVSISGGFSRLTAKPFHEEDFKIPVKKAPLRRTLGYFVKRKFSPKQVIETLEKYGFNTSNYHKVIVTWGWEEEAKSLADSQGIILWDFRDLLKKIAEAYDRTKAYFTDDTLRTLQLFAKALKEKSKSS
jgi:hypothetical protein